VWVGDAYGHEGVACAPAERTEPTHGGRPGIAVCGGAEREFVTVKLTGDAHRRMFLNEVVVFRSAPAMGSVGAVPRRHGDVAAEISARFDAGRPSNRLADGGVLVRARPHAATPPRPLVCRLTPPPPAPALAAAAAGAHLGRV
jgi:hypothetical protein